MTTKTLRRALGAVALLTLALPAAAFAHPSIYSTTAKLAKAQEVQTITLAAAGGTWKPSAGSPPVAWNASATEVQRALWLDNTTVVFHQNATTTTAAIDDVMTPGGVFVTGPNGGPYTLTYSGIHIQRNVNQVAPDGTGLTGIAIPATTTPGGGANIVFPADPATLPTQEMYVLAEHGYAPLYRETNGLSTGGWLELKQLPGGYRANGSTPLMTAQQWIDFAPAVTGLQTHATCQGVAALTDSVVLASNESATEPFYDYVPWQKTSSGVGDDPADWIPDVLAATGVDLNALNTPAELRAACEGEGGTYHAADALQTPITNSVVLDAVTAATAPKDSTIAALTKDNTDLAKEKSDLTALNATLAAAKRAAEDAVAAATNRSVNVTPGAAKLTIANPYAMVTGTAGARFTAKLTVSAAVKRKLGLASTTLGSVSSRFDSQGAKLVTVKLTRVAAAKVAAHRGNVVVSFVASSGASTDKAAAALLS